MPGMNGGWIQIAGPQHRFFDFKDIEVNEFGGALQQVRFPPTRLAHSRATRATNLFMLPGATYVDPELSWQYESGPAGTTFVRGTALGADYEGTLWIGSSRASRRSAAPAAACSASRLSRRPEEGRCRRSEARRPGRRQLRPKFDRTESESLLIGTGFGTTPPSSRVPTATSTSCRLPTARSTRSVTNRGTRQLPVLN